MKQHHTLGLLFVIAAMFNVGSAVVSGSWLMWALASGCFFLASLQFALARRESRRS